MFCIFLFFIVLGKAYLHAPDHVPDYYWKAAVLAGYRVRAWHVARLSKCLLRMNDESNVYLFVWPWRWLQCHVDLANAHVTIACGHCLGAKDGFTTVWTSDFLGNQNMAVLSSDSSY